MLGPMPRPEPELVCVVEIPKGGRNKYEYDPQLGGIKFDRLLMSAATYPTDYGYLRDTLGQDGDPLDALVCLYEPTFPGCLIPVKPVGMFKMTDEKGVDDKIICVPLNDPYWNHTRSSRICRCYCARRSSSSSRSTRKDGAPLRRRRWRSRPRGCEPASTEALRVPRVAHDDQEPIKARSRWASRRSHRVAEDAEPVDLYVDGVTIPEEAVLASTDSGRGTRCNDVAGNQGDGA
jgi:inorganic pyrophosphatase